MQLERYTAEKLIKYLKAHGYPENSIAVEYQIDRRYMVDIAILDVNKNIPIQLFEIKSKKSSEMIKMGKEQLQKQLSFLKNKNIPTYLVFPKDEKPFFEIVNINTAGMLQEQEISQSNNFVLNYPAQRNARIAEEVESVKNKKEIVLDSFRVTSWILAFIVLIIGILAKLKVFQLDATDLTIIIIVIALILVPFASKLKILGFEFERLKSDDK
jgi:hypothetical protein